MNREPKIKPCAVCGQDFKQYKSTVKVCSTRCAITYAREKEEKKRAKEWRKEQKERKEKLKSRADHLNELQNIFNTYIRKRDKDECCISCGKTNGSETAGHYRSVGGFPELRFNEDNCHGQCTKCNLHLHGNLIEYRKRLIDRVGLHVVEWLELNHEPKKYTLEEIKELKTEYRERIRGLK